METIGIILNIGTESVEAFETGFRNQEHPIWVDLHGRGELVMAALNRLDISTKPVEGAVQYLVVAIFATDQGHHLHDNDPRFQAWNAEADSYQIEDPFVFGGSTIVSVGP